MYKTIKVKLRLEEGQRERLLWYEGHFLQSLEDVMNQIHDHPEDIRIKNIHFRKEINVHNHWYVYQLGCKMYKALIMNKKITYGRSSTWGSQGFRIDKNKIYLYIGNSDQSLELCLLMQLDNHQLQNLYKSKILRMDITHKGIEWYVGFLVERET